MPVILSDETWVRIQKMLQDYEGGILRVIPGAGLKYEEQVSQISQCPGTIVGLDVQGQHGGAGGGLSTITLDVCVNGSPETHTFVITS